MCSPRAVQFLLVFPSVLEGGVMALISGPLMSMKARGQLAKSLVYSNWKGRATARVFSSPSDRKTSGQLVQRGLFSDAVSLYVSTRLNSLDIVAHALRLKYFGLKITFLNYFLRNYVDFVSRGLACCTLDSFVVVSNSGGVFNFSVRVVGDTGARYRYGLRLGIRPPGYFLTRVGETDVYTGVVSGYSSGTVVYLGFYGKDINTALVCGSYRIVIA